MKKNILIPSMGESISEVMIGEILISSGSIVKADSEILELETDKVNQVLYALDSGHLELTVKSGDKVQVGQTIGSIETEDSQLPEKIEPADAQLPEKEKISSKPAPQLVSEMPKSQEKGIRYTQEAFIQDLQNPSPVGEEISAESSPVILPKSGKQETRRPLSRIRKVIAQKMVESLQKTAMLTTFSEVDLSHIIVLREKYKEEFMEKHHCKLGYMSFFIKAVVSALQEFPDINSYIEGDEIVHREYMNIGVAVGTEKGVIVPIVRDCDQLSYAQIEQAIALYAKKAREGSLSIEDLQGGGFTITNGGIYGSLLSTPILIYPQTGILGMHKIEKRAVVIHNEIVIRSMMYLALSYDHRLIDGKEAVSFLSHIKDRLEDTSRALLDI